MSNDKSKISYSEDQKKIILEYCLKDATHLYEKFTHDVNRKSQSCAWQHVADELKSKEQIIFENVSKLKQNVSNWIRRATAANDQAKRTGAGKQPKLTEFQEMCLSFVSAAKGSTAVNYIQPIEPSGNSAASTSKAIEDQESGSDINVPPVTTKRSAVYKKKPDESWKEKYFQSMVSNDERFYEANIRKSDLKSYNLLLKNISLEKSLDLQQHEIIGLRSSISPLLLSLPTPFSEISCEEMPMESTEGTGYQSSMQEDDAN